MLENKRLNPSNRLTRKQAADYIGVKSSTLSVWAVTGRYNLPYYKIGRLVYYNQIDLDAFIEERRVGDPLVALQWEGA